MKTTERRRKTRERKHVECRMIKRRRNVTMEWEKSRKQEGRRKERGKQVDLEERT